MEVAHSFRYGVCSCINAAAEKAGLLMLNYFLGTSYTTWTVSHKTTGTTGENL